MKTHHIIASPKLLKNMESLGFTHKGGSIFFLKGYENLTFDLSASGESMDDVIKNMISQIDEKRKQGYNELVDGVLMVSINMVQKLHKLVFKN